MPRYRILIEYDGTPFVGWQTQALGQSIQGALEDGFSEFLGRKRHRERGGPDRIRRACAGQVAHFDLEKNWDSFRVREAMNFTSSPRRSRA